MPSDKLRAEKVLNNDRVKCHLPRSQSKLTGRGMRRAAKFRESRANSDQVVCRDRDPSGGESRAAHHFQGKK